jgi:hypothetical protein
VYYAAPIFAQAGQKVFHQVGMECIPDASMNPSQSQSLVWDSACSKRDMYPAFPSSGVGLLPYWPPEGDPGGSGNSGTSGTASLDFKSGWDEAAAGGVGFAKDLDSSVTAGMRSEFGNMATTLQSRWAAAGSLTGEDWAHKTWTVFGTPIDVDVRGFIPGSPQAKWIVPESMWGLTRFITGFFFSVWGLYRIWIMVRPTKLFPGQDAGESGGKDEEE